MAGSEKKRFEMVSPAAIQDGILGVDWGTTNGRVYVLGGHDRPVALVPGFAKVPPGGFPETLFKAIEGRPERRIVICGMAGARGGWWRYLMCRFRRAWATLLRAA